MNIDNVTAYWVDTSRYDMETAEGLFQIKRYPYVLFMCHLGVEKLLKAIIVKLTGKHADYTHNLVYLAGKTKLDFTDPQLDLLAEMNEFNIEARYPEAKMDFYKECTEDYTLKYLNRTREIYKWLTEQLERL
jgi:HEPN domain-containing protein